MTILTCISDMNKIIFSLERVSRSRVADPSIRCNIEGVGDVRNRNRVHVGISSELCANIWSNIDLTVCWVSVERSVSVLYWFLMWCDHRE